ncbi:MAG: 2-hydroxychromene-2-carboxylate isomerase [Candidatus Azotimanducaceae bacterium]|jgi:2-hydroxychromene-2-carboxylate isomerase
MGVLASERLLGWQKAKAGYLRRFRFEQPRVYYFHTVNDPYSHLAVQKLDALREKYALDFVVHLAKAPDDTYKGDGTRFDAWARRDAQLIAPFFDTDFSLNAASDFQAPDSESIAIANGHLVSLLKKDAFADEAIRIGEALWQGDLPRGAAISSNAHLNMGTQMRKRLGHYYGGMFYFEGEWFWGVDRLHLLEQRLQNEGFGSGDFVCPMPVVPEETAHTPSDEPLDTRGVLLEYFPSLRSPYTAIGHQRVLDLVERTGVEFHLRPVMPMMMRGVPAPFAKQRYIIADAAREARYYGVKFGPMADPFGEPVKRAFAVYAAAEKVGCGTAFVTQYLNATFAEGLPIWDARGLHEVCRRAEFDPSLIDHNADWQSQLEENINAMNHAGLWGVPSFRVSGGSLPGVMNCWGQDRIWRVEAEIIDRSKEIHT